ncbi:MAG: hypothetical protein AB7G11_17885 [Phycisphaerales bacterium]
MSTRSFELATECQRQFENCLYSAASFTIWLKWLRGIRIVQISSSLILGAFASWSLVSSSPNRTIQLMAAIAAFLAGLMPAICAALKIDDRIEDCRRLSGEFTNLRDRFRQAALIHSRKPFAEFEREFKPIMDRMDSARSTGITPPDFIFRLAQKKIKTGDYTFDIDIARDQSEPVA